jgi:anti-sigma regulatory factor (Ser/Thr protein kinase)
MPHRAVADDLSDVGRATAWVGEQAAEAELADDLRYNVEVCVEEALANLVQHGRPIEGAKDITIRVTADDASATIVITDRCLPFDSTRAPPQAPSGSAMLVGGRGLRLMQALASGLAYRTSGGRNELTMRFRSPP